MKGKKNTTAIRELTEEIRQLREIVHRENMVGNGICNNGKSQKYGKPCNLEPCGYKVRNLPCGIPNEGFQAVVASGDSEGDH